MKIRRLYPRFDNQPKPLKSMKHSMEELDVLIENHYKSNVEDNVDSLFVNFWKRCFRFLSV